MSPNLGIMGLSPMLAVEVTKKDFFKTLKKKKVTSEEKLQKLQLEDPFVKRART